jgi:hypothetical protein
MSIVLIRDAFTRAAGDRLQLHSILMHYAEDRRAQRLTVTGTFPDGAKFDATTEPFLGDTSVIMERAAKLAEEVMRPHDREQGVAITHTGADSDLVTAPEPDATPKPKSWRRAKR